MKPKALRRDGQAPPCTQRVLRGVLLVSKVLGSCSDELTRAECEDVAAAISWARRRQAWLLEDPKREAARARKRIDPRGTASNGSPVPTVGRTTK